MNEYKVVDITGQRFGRLTVINRDTNKHKRSGTHWLCRCDCGNECVVLGTNLRNGNTKSCGCIRKENGTKIVSHRWGDKDTGLWKEHKRIYGVWIVMRERCNNPKWPQYKHYGGRGITICEEWDSFKAFMEWAYANGYDKDAKRGECTIDRIDNSKEYSPNNCRWVTLSENLKNRRSWKRKKPA